MALPALLTPVVTAENTITDSVVLVVSQYGVARCGHAWDESYMVGFLAVLRTYCCGFNASLDTTLETKAKRKILLNWFQLSPGRTVVITNLKLSGSPLYSAYCNDKAVTVIDDTARSLYTHFRTLSVQHI